MSPNWHGQAHGDEHARMQPRLPTDDAYWDDLAERVTASARRELPGRPASAIPRRRPAGRAAAASSWLAIGDLAVPLATAAMLALIAGYGLLPDAPALDRLGRDAGGSLETERTVGASPSAVVAGGRGPISEAGPEPAVAGQGANGVADIAPAALVEAALSPRDPLARALLRDPAPPSIVGLLALRDAPPGTALRERR